MKKRVISKDYLLEVAHTIALQEGPEGLSIRNVAKHADVSIGSVYNYFESKEDLTQSLISNIWNLFYDNIINESSSISSYTEFLNNTYTSLYKLTQDMYSIFDFHLKNSSETQRERAFETHAHQVGALHNLFLKMMHQDTQIKANIWSEDFTEESFNMFVVKNYFGSIKRKEPNVNFLITLIKKILY